MKYYLVTDVGTQWFSYLVSVHDGQTIDCLEVPNDLDGSLLRNIYGREQVDQWMNLRHGGMVLGGGSFGGWSVSRLEFDRIKRLIELTPAVVEFNRIRDSV